MANAIHLTAENYDKEVNQADVPVIIDFWASWCAPCMMMAPVFEEFAGEYHEAGTAKLCKLSTEEEPGIAQQHGIRGIPTLGVFHKGKEIERIVGFAPKDLLKEKIDAAIKKAR
ncbi:thioredoxin [Candidatus Woesearchaeota archaeon]|nr:thioredoxin [Candidatus Woesearchaeota archaeon]